MYVITHKSFDYHDLPQGYRPLLVGADQHPNPDHFLQDNQGDNISNRNPYYSELTGLYWLWKHADDQRLGISHYRRYFAREQSPLLLDVKALIVGRVKPIEVKALDHFLDAGAAWIVAKPQIGGAGTLWEQFDHFHHIHDLEITRQVIADLQPDYLSAFDQVLHYQQKASFYNMFYTSRAEFNQYASWLFTILFAVEDRTDVSSYNDYQKRLYGFLSERLFNVWLKHRQAEVKFLVEYNRELVSRKWAARTIKHDVLGW